VNNNITIEKLDAVIERVNSATYAEAKKALLDCDGDVIEAVILLESVKGFGSKTKQAKKTMEGVLSKDNEDIKELKLQVKELLKKSSVIRVIVEKNEKTVMNIPLTVGVVGLALGPLVTLVGLSAAVIGKYQIKIQNEDDGSIVDLGELNEEKLSMLKQMLTSTAKEVKDVVVDHKKDNADAKDITDELIEEDEKIDIDKK
jgi:membrane-associated HD superfamily phosphohydrolase